MTPSEKELVVALEADIQRWESEADFFEHSITEIDVLGGPKMSGRDYARGLHRLIAERRALIEKTRNS